MRCFNNLRKRFSKRGYNYLIWDYYKEKQRIRNELENFTLEELKKAKFKIECSLPSDKGHRKFSAYNSAFSYSALMISLISLSFTLTKEFVNASVIISNTKHPAGLYLTQIITYTIFGLCVFAFIMEIIGAFCDKKSYRINKLKLDIVSELIFSMEKHVKDAQTVKYISKHKSKVKVYRINSSKTA